MTTYDLDTLALTIAGEELTDENRLAHAALLLNAYNEAYFHACASALKPEARREVALDAYGRFDPEALEPGAMPGGVLCVAAGCGAAEQLLLFSRCGDGKYAVHGAAGGARVFVTYRAKPGVLMNEAPLIPGSGDTPQLMPEEFHGALAAYAAAAFFRARRKFERMRAWADAWQEALERMRGGGARHGLRLENAFAPMP